MKKNKFIFILVVILVMFAFTANLSFANEPIVLRFGHIMGTDQPGHKGVEEFKNYVEDKSDGQIIIDIYPASQLGHSRELLELIQMGGLEMTMVGISGLSSFDPRYSWYEVPFVFDSFEQVHKYWNSSGGNVVADEFLKETGLRQLSATWERLPRNMISTKRFETVDEFKGIKMRVPNAMFRTVMQTLGAIPVSLAFAEIYTGMQTGVVDAAESPLDYFFSYALHEVADYAILTNHTYGTQAFIIGESTWGILGEEQKAIILDGMREGEKLNNDIIANSYGKYLDLMEEEGMEVITPEIDGFKEKMDQAYKSFFDEWGEKVFRDIQNIK